MNATIFWRILWKEYRSAAGVLDLHGRVDAHGGIGLAGRPLGYRRPSGFK